MELIKAEVNSLDTVNITVDGWSDATMRSFAGYTLQGLDEEFVMHTIPICFEAVYG
jgi:hypothetical protein